MGRFGKFVLGIASALFLGEVGLGERVVCILYIIDIDLNELSNGFSYLGL